MASGDTLVVFTPHSNEPPAANYASVDLRNVHLVLDFNDATAQSAVFSSILPRNYAGGGVTVTIVWMGGSAGLLLAAGQPVRDVITPLATGSVKWNAAFERHQAGTDDLDTDSFATAQTAAGAAPTTDGSTQYTSIAFTSGAQMDSLAVGESFRLKITRDAGDGTDTMTGDAELLCVELRET
jgi:hypothetical protein